MSLKKHIKAFLNPDFKSKKDIIKINRIYALFAGLLTPVFAYGIFGYDEKRLAIDITLMVFFFLAFISSYLSEFVKKNFTTVLFIGYIHATLNVLYINYNTGFQLDYFIGLLTAIIFIGLVIQNHKLATLYSVLALLMTGVTIYLSGQIHNLPELPQYYLLLIFSFGVVNFFVSRFRSLFYSKIDFNNSLLSRVFQDSPDALFLVKKETNIIENVNDSVLLLFKTEDKFEFLNKDYLEFSKTFKKGRKFFQDEFLKDEQWHKESKYKDANGHVIWVDQVVSEIVFNYEQYFLIRMTDISERRANQEHLEKLSLAVEQNPSIVVIYDAQTKVQFINRTFEKVTGILQEEMIGTYAKDHNEEEYINVVREEGQWKGDVIHYKKDGTFLIERAQISPIVDRKGNITHFVKVSEDITEKQNTEEQLKVVLDNIDEIVYSIKVDEEGNKSFSYISPKVKDIFGFTQEEYRIRQQEIQDAYHPEDFPNIKKIMKRLKDNPEPKRVTYRFKHRLTGEYIWVEENLFPKVNEKGNIRTIFGVVRNINHRIKSQEKIKESEEKFRLLYSKANDAILIVDEGKIVDCNEQAIKMFKGERRDIINSSPFIFYPEKQPNGSDSILRGYEMMQEALQGKSQRYYWKHWSINGPQFDTEVSINAFEVKGKKLLQYMIRDVTARMKAESEKLETIESYFELFNQSTSFIFIVDKSFKLIDVNDTVTKYFDNPKDEMLETDLLSLVQTTENIDFSKKLTSTFNDNQEIFDCYINGNNKSTPVEVVLNKGSYFGKEVVIVRGRDISTRLTYEKTLQESEERFRTLSWSAPIGIFQQKADGQTTYINQRIIQLFGVLDPLSFDTKMMGLIHPDDIDRIRYKKEESIERGEGLSYEYRLIKDGKETWLSVRVKVINNEEGKVIGRIGTIEDITDRKLYEKNVEENEERFNILSDVTLEAIILTDNGIITDVNNRFLKMYGYRRRSEAIGMNVMNIVSSEYHDSVKERMQKDKNPTKEFNHIKKDGDLFTVESRSEMILYNNKNIRVYVVNDISKRKQAQSKLIRSEHNYKKLVEILPDGLILHDHGTIIYANPEAIKLFDCEKSDDIIGTKLIDYVHPADKERVQGRIEKVQNEREKVDYQESKLITDKDRIKTVESCHIPYIMDGKPVVKLVVRNISDRKRVELEKLRAELAEENSRRLELEINERKEAERKLRLAEQFTRSIIDSSLDMIYATNVNNQITEFNQSAQSILGYTLAESFSISPSDLFVDLEEHQRVKAALEIDGEFSGEIRSRAKDGREFPSFLSASVLVNQKGEIVGEMGISRDITKLKENEQEIKESLKEKEVLLKEVHHRVKNNMQVISSILNLQTSYVQDDYTIELLRECQNRIKSMAFIHESLYQSKDISNIHFNSYIENLCTNLHYSYSSNNKQIGLNFDFEEVLLKLDTAIPCGLIVNELISNALKYAFADQDSGNINVSIKTTGEDQYCLEVGDDGKGLEEGFVVEDSDSLGLQLVVTLVDQIDGELEVIRDNGLKFIIRFKDL